MMLLFTILLVACSPAAEPLFVPSPDVFVGVPPKPTPLSSPTWATEQGAPLQTSIPPSSAETQNPSSMLTQDPGQVLIPTASSTPAVEHRPPLYPTPWALSPHDHFYFASPIAAFYPGELEWDYRYGGIFFGPEIVHSGVDIPSPRGTDVLAAGPGTVVWAGVGLFAGSKYELDDPYGLAVAIRHDFGYDNEPLYTIYAHMEEVDVMVGQWVKTGAVLGNVGSTGLTTGPHLHFEVRLGKNDFFYTRNPELWLSPPIGEGVLVGRITSTFGTILTSYLVSLKSLATGQWTQATTYGPQVVNCDPFYNENVVISNLPAGIYELNIPYGALNRIIQIQILPGQVTYFAFHGYAGYVTGSPEPSPTPTHSP